MDPRQAQHKAARDEAMAKLKQKRAQRLSHLAEKSQASSTSESSSDSSEDAEGESDNEDAGNELKTLPEVSGSHESAQQCGPFCAFCPSSPLDLVLSYMYLSFFTFLSLFVSFLSVSCVLTSLRLFS